MKETLKLNLFSRYFRVSMTARCSVEEVII